MPLDSIEIFDMTEGLDFEVKKAAGRDGQGQLPESFFSTYSAMANSEGGVVLLGVEETAPSVFQVVGVGNPEKVIKELWNSLNNREKTNINILTDSNVSTRMIEGKRVIQITVPRATRQQMPVFEGKDVFRGTYRRHGEGDYGCD